MDYRIVIDNPGDGDRIMEKSGGMFNDKCEHSIAAYDGQRFLGGFVVGAFLGNSVAIHDGSDDPQWCTRTLLWMLFDYVFNQLGVHKAYAPVRSDNWSALSMDIRAGWRLEYVMLDAFEPGVHNVLLAMEPSYCKWLDVRPVGYAPGKTHGQGVGTGQS